MVKLQLHDTAIAPSRATVNLPVKVCPCVNNAQLQNNVL